MTGQYSGVSKQYSNMPLKECSAFLTHGEAK
jgi:hypothetical protein